MSNSRSERRRQARGGSAPPPKRDPMTAVYIAAVAVIVVIIAAFFVYNEYQQHQVQEAYATPTPAASPVATSKPIQLTDGETIGKPTFTLYHGLPDTPSGGRGQPVDSITCGGMEYNTLHTHTHLAIFYHGKQIAVPKLVGGVQIGQGGCLYWIHTHSMDGILHVESPTLAPEGSAGFDLGMFFDIWGQPLTRDNVAGLKGPVIAYVNNTLYDGDLRMIPLRSHQQVVLEIGTPAVSPPVYIFPPGD
ncbi:MAG TPA: hypothetical protein VMA98_01520 [Candidatus Acidoferrales bacterium]|nr:hypothetical protein [Candidatus Acidoferrales bacterium]